MSDLNVKPSLSFCLFLNSYFIFIMLSLTVNCFFAVIGLTVRTMPY